MGGIGSILAILAIGGFIVAAIGVALIVAAVSQGRPVRGGIVLVIVGLVLGVLLMVVGNGILEVGATQVAVIFNTLTGELETPRRSGISIIAPGIHQVSLYPIGQQEYTMSGSDGEDSSSADAVEARSVDGQQVTMDVTILFRIDPAKVNQIHLDWSATPGGYGASLIRAQTRSVVRDIVGGFEAEGIYGGGREEMQTQIENELRERVEARGFFLDDVLIRGLTFSDQFTDAIEQKQIAEQRLEQSRTEAERARTEAAGRADAAIEQARGEAEAILVRAASEAEALRLVSEQIAANPNLLQYVYIQNLADNISLALIPSNSPFLFDSSTFTDLAPGFVPPAVPDELIPDVEETPAGD